MLSSVAVGDRLEGERMGLIADVDPTEDLETFLMLNEKGLDPMEDLGDSDTDSTLSIDDTELSRSLENPFSLLSVAVVPVDKGSESNLTGFSLVLVLSWKGERI